MAFPNQISTADNYNYGFPGPFLVGGNYYTLLVNGGTDQLEMFLSTDNGNTWTVQDAANGPGDDTSYPFTAVVIGTTIWAVNADTSTGNQEFTPFDTLTNTWGTPSVTANDCSINRGTICATVRSGKILITGQPNSRFYLGRVRCAYMTFDPGTLVASGWTPFGIIGFDNAHGCQCCAILQGTSGEVAFVLWIWPTTTAAATSTLAYQTLDSSNTLGTQTTIDTATISGRTQPVEPVGFSDGTNAVIGWKQKTADLAMQVYKAPASTWSWGSPQTVSLPGGETALGSIAVTISSTAFYAFLFSQDATPSTNIYEAEDTGTGFGAVTLVGTNAGETSAGGNNLWAAPLVATAWGIEFYTTGSQICYFWGGGSGPPPPPTPKNYVSAGGALGNPGSYGSA